MRRIAHVSDMHFGKFDPAVSRGLFNTLIELNPHFVIVSGDLTQRARNSEFEDAKKFFAGLQAAGIAWMAIPGNHDIAPFYTPLSRLFTPFKKYRKYISDRTQLFYTDEEVAVTSINTVRRLQIENGRVTRAQIEEVRMWFSALPKHVVRLVVTHHPLYRHPTKRLRTPAWRIGKSMSKLRETGVDVYISGHLHRTSFRRSDALVVQAGTVSERLRGEMPSFNLLTIDSPHFKVETYRWEPESGVFKPGRPSVLLIKNKPPVKPILASTPHTKKLVGSRRS
jgi:3',5'-cyclic AMP phosphodiesterase CpdA